MIRSLGNRIFQPWYLAVGVAVDQVGFHHVTMHAWWWWEELFRLFGFAQVPALTNLSRSEANPVEDRREHRWWDSERARPGSRNGGRILRNVRLTGSDEADYRRIDWNQRVPRRFFSRDVWAFNSWPWPPVNATAIS